MSNRENSAPVCVVAGVGPGNGVAFSEKFAARGYRVAMLGRDAGKLKKLGAHIPDATAYACDLTNEAEVGAVFGRIASELGPVSVLIYNAGIGIWGDIESISSQVLEEAWRTNVLGCFLAARAVIPAMKGLGGGSIIVVGATASLRGGAKFAAFTAAKAGQRALAQSMARHLGKSGIHVAYVVIDGVVLSDRAREFEQFKDKPDDFFLNPADIAEAVYRLAQQPKSAWSFEIDLRPHGEQW